MTALMTPPTAEVLLDGEPAATLTRTRAGTVFAYRPGWNGRAVATTLGLGEERVTPAGAVPAFFAGLLPEGRRLLALQRSVKTSADDDLGLLLAVGGDPVGDVQVVPPGGASAPVEPVVGDLATTSFADLLAASGLVDPVALAGIQDKVSAGMLSLPVRSRSGAAILKLDPPEYPGVVENEAYFLTLARRGGLPAASATPVHDADGRAGLLVERFDRVRDGESVRRLPVEDACQVLDRYPADKYRPTSEEVALAVADLCAARPLALREVFRQFVFAWLTGNGDLHAKNISIVRADEEWRVAPMYDLPSSLAYGDTTMALPLAGRRENLTRKAFHTFADTIGLPRRAADATLAATLRATGPLLDEVEAGALGLSDGARRTYLRRLGRRRRDLDG